MFSARRWIGVGALLLMMACCGPARAARVQVHYAPDASGNMTGTQTTSNSISFFGGPPPVTAPVQPNQIVRFRHPATGATVNVPLALPEGTPKMRYRSNRVVYDYGSDTVEVRFLNDGTVDVIYNSGFLRRW